MAQRNKGVFWRKYKWQLNRAKDRGVPFLLSFEEWCDIWQSSGKWEQRGRLRGQYVMARFGDTGPYERSNVKICLVGENVAESNRDMDHPPERRAAAMKAWWASASQEQRDSISRNLSVNNASHRPEVRAKQSLAAKERWRRYREARDAR
jgi:hypothetical protein